MNSASTTVSKGVSQTVDGVNINVTITTESPDSDSAVEVANRIESAVSDAILIEKWDFRAAELNEEETDE